ncbi:MAG: DUF4355 domain-containing protein [Oscillospiraceae bacterium]
MTKIAKEENQTLNDAQQDISNAAETKALECAATETDTVTAEHDDNTEVTPENNQMQILSLTGKQLEELINKRIEEMAQAEIEDPKDVEIRKLRNEINQKNLIDYAISQLSEQGLPIELMNVLQLTNNDAITKQVATLSKAIVIISERRIEQKIRGSQHVPFSNIGNHLPQKNKQDSLGELFNDRNNR